MARTTCFGIPARRRPRATVAGALLLTLSACGGCEGEDGMAKERQRLWGREKIAAEIETKAKEKLDAHALDERPDVRARVLGMRFAEVVARLGFLTYAGTARFSLERNGQRLPVFEDTVIEHGLHGSYRVLQKDEDEAVMRETVYVNGVYYVRNGPGKLRVAGSKADQASVTTEQAFEPLRSFTSYYGPRLGLAEAGTKTIGGRTAVAYDLLLLEGSELVEAPGMKGKKKPISLKGKVYVDEATAAPLGAKLTGRLGIPPPEGKDDWGSLELSLDFTIQTNEGKEVKPGEYIPTIKRRPVDLNPLAFLDGGTRTSTVIGGKKANKADKKPEAEPADEP